MVPIGTDLHCLVEIQAKDGTWHPVLEQVWPNAEAEAAEDLFARVPILSRHYGLFSVLADVRNRTGRGRKAMMSIKHPDTGEYLGEYEYDTDDGGHQPLTPIAEPRGIPKDASDMWKKFARQEHIHDPSCLSLDELLPDREVWDQVLYEDAIVTEEEYVAWRDTGALPKFHVRSAGGPALRVVSPEEYEAGERGEDTTAVYLHWTGQSVREDVDAAWWATIAVMRIIAKERPVRLMVAFDS